MPSAARNIVIEVCSSSFPVCFLLAFSSSLLLPLLSGSCLLSIRFPSSCLPSLRLVFRFVSLSSLLLRLSPWRFRPCLGPSYSMSSPACMRDYLCPAPFSTFRLFGTSLPLSSLPSPDVRFISSSLRSLSSSFFSCACSRSLLASHVACFVCVPAVLLLSSIALFALLPSPQIRSRRSRGVSRVTPPHERAPLTSVVIPVGSVFRRRAAPPALECYLIRLPGF